jgi:hypothetical protein
MDVGFVGKIKKSGPLAGDHIYHRVHFHGSWDHELSNR